MAMLNNQRVHQPCVAPNLNRASAQPQAVLKKRSHLPSAGSAPLKNALPDGFAVGPPLRREGTCFLPKTLLPTQNLRIS